MVLADTSIWIGHLRQNDAALGALLCDGAVLTHPFVLGELSCGNLRNRTAILGALPALPAAVAASHDETLGLVRVHALWGLGIGWVDAHLIASALLSACALWTRDAGLARAAARAGAKRYRGS